MDTPKHRPTIGLALGSGGIRGIAHIGVIKVLEKAGIPIDYIAGSSIGAMIGGLYALHKDIKIVETIALSVDWQTSISLIDPSIRQGLVKGAKLEQFLRDQVGFVAIEKLRIPLKIIATDLATGQMVGLDKGDLIEAIRASISVPLVFKPVSYRGWTLADGGLSMPVPVEIARQMGADIVIAVNIEGDLFDYRRSLRPGLAAIALTSIDALRYHLAEQETNTADIAITVHSRGGKLIEEVTWDAKKLISAGERYAKAALPTILERLGKV